MNYIELINQFWEKDLEYCYSEREIALYFYLLNVCNGLRWKNPFGQSNAVIVAKFGWGRSSFDTAKKRLKDTGLIDFKSGDGRGNVYQYEIKGAEKGCSNDTPLSKGARKGARKGCSNDTPLPKEMNTQGIDTKDLNANGTEFAFKHKYKQNINKREIRSQPPPFEETRIDPMLQERLDAFIAAWNERTNQKPYKALVPSDNDVRGFIDLLNRYGPEGPGMLLQAVCESEWLQRDPKTLSWAIKQGTATKLIDGGFAEDYKKSNPTTTNKQTHSQMSFRDNPDKFERMKNNAK